MKKKTSAAGFVLFVTDLCVIFLCLLLSSLYAISPLVLPRSHLTLGNVPFLWLFVFVASVWFFGSKNLGLYDDVLTVPLNYQILLGMKSIAFQFVFLAILLFLTKESLLTRKFLFSYVLLLALCVVSFRVLVDKLIKRLSGGVSKIHRTLVVRLRDISRDNCASIARALSSGRDFIGQIGDGIDDIAELPNLGNLKDLQRVLGNQRIDEVILLMSQYDPAMFEAVVQTCEDNMVDIRFIRGDDSIFPRRYREIYVGGYPVIAFENSKSNEFYWRLLKRCFDLGVSCVVAIIVLSWLVPLMILLQKILNRGPIFYRSERVGFRGERFVIYKFRTMMPNSERTDKSVKYEVAHPGDPRTTKFGRILRSTNLDEVPQVLNILKGEMSIVGPRPLDYFEVEQLKPHVNRLMLRHYVKPGLTGWAQVNGLRGGTRDSQLMQKRISYDLWYVRNWSFGLDIQIILMTIFKFFSGDANAY